MRAIYGFSFFPFRESLGDAKSNLLRPDLQTADYRRTDNVTYRDEAKIDKNERSREKEKIRVE